MTHFFTSNNKQIEDHFRHSLTIASNALTSSVQRGIILLHSFTTAIVKPVRATTVRFPE